MLSRPKGKEEYRRFQSVRLAFSMAYQGKQKGIFKNQCTNTYCDMQKSSDSQQIVT